MLAGILRGSLNYPEYIKGSSEIPLISLGPLTSAFSAALYTRGLKSSHRGSDQGMSDQAISYNTKISESGYAIKTKYIF